MNGKPGQNWVAELLEGRMNVLKAMKGGNADKTSESARVCELLACGKQRVIGLKKGQIVSYWPVAIFCDFCPYVFVRIKLNQRFVDMPKNLSMT